MGPFSGVLQLPIFKIFWPLRPNRDTKLSLHPQRSPFNVKMLSPAPGFILITKCAQSVTVIIREVGSRGFSGAQPEIFQGRGRYLGL